MKKVHFIFFIFVSFYFILKSILALKVNVANVYLELPIIKNWRYNLEHFCDLKKILIVTNWNDIPNTICNSK